MALGLTLVGFGSLFAAGGSPQTVNLIQNQPTPVTLQVRSFSSDTVNGVGYLIKNLVGGTRVICATTQLYANKGKQ
jgi:hypothetical protein